MRYVYLVVIMTEDVIEKNLYFQSANLMKRGTISSFSYYDVFMRVGRDAMMNKKELALVFEQLEREHIFSGAILIAQDEEVVFEKAYGFASRQLNVPNVLETKFHIASVTKMFILMTSLILSEQGLIEFHEKPSAYVRELAVLDKDMTLHHLLSHTFNLQEFMQSSISDKIWRCMKLT